ncbi:MAG: LamG-like jellyroll fold domain-containing protein [Candidatus Woesearchaeota archaeon]
MRRTNYILPASTKSQAAQPFQKAGERMRSRHKAYCYGRVLPASQKSQAAMEFLMTYGWALIAILLVMGLFSYFGFFRPGGFFPDSIRFNDPRLELLSTSDYRLVLFNRGDDTLHDVVISLPEYGCLPSPHATLRSGESRSIYLVCNSDEISTTSSTRLRASFIAEYERVVDGQRISQTNSVRGAFTARVIPFSPGEDANILSYFSFDEDAQDYFSPEAVAISSEQAPVHTIGKKARGYEFTEGSYFSVNYEGQPVRDEMSFVFWVLPKVSSDGTMVFLTTEQNFFDSVSDVSFLLQTQWDSDRLQFQIRNLPFIGSVRSANDLKINEWNFVGVSFNQGNVLLYVNGIATHTVVGIEQMPGWNELMIGSARQSSEDGFTPIHSTRGILDEIFLFDYALTEEDFKQLYDIMK